MKLKSGFRRQELLTLGTNLYYTSTSAALTACQRVELMMQLDGLSRKDISDRLQISLDTVGDHKKKIYEHFSISSSGEVGALLLRNR